MKYRLCFSAAFSHGVFVDFCRYLDILVGAYNKLRLKAQKIQYMRHLRGNQNIHVAVDLLSKG